MVILSGKGLHDATLVLLIVEEEEFNALFPPLRKLNDLKRKLLFVLLFFDVVSDATDDEPLFDEKYELLNCRVDAEFLFEMGLKLEL